MIEIPAEFWSDISHQLRSPFTSIKLNMSLAKKYSNSEAAASLAKAETNIDIVLKRINLLVLAMQVKEHKVKFLYEFFDLQAAAEELASEIFPSKRYNFEPKKLQILGDKALLNQSLRYIFDSVKRTSEGGPSITFSANAKTAQIELEFIPVPAKTTNKDELTEITEGLFIAEEVLKMHGGTIEKSGNTMETYTIKIPIKAKKQMTSIRGLSA